MWRTDGPIIFQMFFSGASSPPNTFCGLFPSWICDINIAQCVRLVNWGHCHRNITRQALRSSHTATTMMSLFGRLWTAREQGATNWCETWPLSSRRTAGDCPEVWQSSFISSLEQQISPGCPSHHDYWGGKKRDWERKCSWTAKWAD